MLRAAKLLLLLAGIGVALWLAGRHAGDLRDSLGRMGWGFGAYMAASFTVYALDTWGWRLVFARAQPPVGFWRLFSMRMGGEAVNKITPLASMGGEPLKAYLLTARGGAAPADALSSVAVAKNVMTIAQVLFIFAGVLLAVPRLPGREGLLLALTLFPGGVLGAIIVTAVIDHRLRRRGGGSRPSPRVGGRRAALALWSQMADFYWAHPREAAASLLLFFLGWAAGALELLAATLFLNLPLTLADALVLEALLCSVNMATFFIPANAGSQEGGFALLAPLLGLTAGHGVTLAVLRRARDVLWVGFGVLYLALTEGRVLFRPAAAAAEEAV